ncbi:Response regulator protein VraR [Pirellula sp. SH-Sr6A]|uniref:LuxR C-terminal-related transcriptional regulator n=1 Tax=Pirellula sp. SH-Sr6A TaxID=1632865 RepID=UPI00078D9943|nr:response regulator transcription factor [Pirellula sp. SH-Sr6A]AMV34998.1 Response regulator protein VraR [Pirellula sp. SH-Sr6A]
MPIQILLIDSQEVTRLGIRATVAETDIVVAADAASLSEAQSHAANNAFDLILTDIRVGNVDVLPWLAKLKLEQSRQNILFLTNTENATHIARIYSIGANGIISKSTSPEQLLNAMRSAASGESLWTKEELKRMSCGLGTAKAFVETDVPITAREAEVLKKIAAGCSNREIAQSLGISFETVKEHIQHLFRKLGAGDRTQAAIWAVRQNIV